MKVTSQLRVGDKLEIEPAFDKEKEKTMEIKSQLVDIKSDMLYISNPIKQGMVYPLSPGQKIKIMFFRQDKGVYSFTAEVIEQFQYKILAYIIKPLSDGKKIQRRDYYRLQALVKVLVKKTGEEEFKEGFTKDISGGGIKLVVKKEFRIYDEVECNIYLDQTNFVTVIGTVIRVEKDGITNEHILSIEYEKISDETKEQIVAFIFKKQRELRKKGLI